MVSIRSLRPLQSWWVGRHASLLGIDIAPDAVRLVELQRARRGGWILRSAGVAPLTAQHLPHASGDHCDELAETLQHLVKTSGACSRRAALALPAAAVITRRIRVPAGLSEEELELHIEFEASHYVPFSLDEVSLDFCVLGPVAAVGQTGGNEGGLNVLLAASRKERVRQQQALAEAAGLQPVVLDIESHAWHRAVLRQLPSDAGFCALLVQRGSTSSLLVLQDQDIVFEREQAADALAWPGSASAAPASDGAMAQELARMLQLFQAEVPDSPLARVLLAAEPASADPARLAQDVAQIAGLPVQCVDPFAGMALATELPAGQGAGFLTACGLALWEGLA